MYMADMVEVFIYVVINRQPIGYVPNDSMQYLIAKINPSNVEKQCKSIEVTKIKNASQQLTISN